MYSLVLCVILCSGVFNGRIREIHRSQGTPNCKVHLADPSAKKWKGCGGKNVRMFSLVYVKSCWLAIESNSVRSPFIEKLGWLAMFFPPQLKLNRGVAAE